MAPYCITMLLTLDYGETAKGKPEAPKAQTPYYCTGQSRASSSENSTQRVQDSPSVNKKTPALRAPDSKLQGEKGGAHRPTRPQGLRVTEAFRLVSPYIKDFEAKPTDKKPNPDPPVQSSSITVCISFAAPTMASVGQALMHITQPIQMLSSIMAICLGL